VGNPLAGHAQKLGQMAESALPPQTAVPSPRGTKRPEATTTASLKWPTETGTETGAGVARAAAARSGAADDVGAVGPKPAAPRL
jgi:hypothetical protein